MKTIILLRGFLYIEYSEISWNIIIGDRLRMRWGKTTPGNLGRLGYIEIGISSYESDVILVSTIMLTFDL